MDFKLTNELKMLQKMYRSFAENEVKPIAAEVDEEERFPKETIPKLARYGFMGIPYPKEYGGQGGTALSYAMAIEEISKVCATTGTIVAAHTSADADLPSRTRAPMLPDSRPPLFSKETIM